MTRFRHRKKCKGCNKLIFPCNVLNHKCKVKVKEASA